MPDKELQRLRNLRFQAEQMLRMLVDDLKPFRAEDQTLGFRRTPTSTPEPGVENDMNVTTTCSCLMALTMFGKLQAFYGDEYKRIVAEILENLVRAKWMSSGLAENNAFTTTLVLRCYGFLRESPELALPEKPLSKMWSMPRDSSNTAKPEIQQSDRISNPSAHGPLTLEAIAQALARDIQNFSINKYPPASAVVYWFLDGIDRANLDLKDGLKRICDFATEEFRRQRSLVTAHYTAMMDPVAMAMAACLCARLRRVLKKQTGRVAPLDTSSLPSDTELQSSIAELFASQTDSGLWPKYFPLFHYNEAGSNFCYTFELLEAVLLEFGDAENPTLLSETILLGLERAVASCERDRLETMGREYGTRQDYIPYHGWNSGGNLATLRKEQPESWATAVVHMFLRELYDQVSEHIREKLLVAYDAQRDHVETISLDKMLDVRVRIGSQDQSLRAIFKDRLIPKFSDFKGAKSKQLLKRPAPKGPVSALLFGPPGTSKTQVAKAIAAALDWPLVEIDPSRFLKNTFENLYVQAEEIFNDATDMYGVIILFDELDALVQKRGGASQDTESTFLTTYMLPKLAKLHDAGRSIFLMATNFEERFDDAIKRAGRFDMLLCMGPPTLEEKCSRLEIFLGKGKETHKGGELILQYSKSLPEIYDRLALYTFGEFKTFVVSLGSGDDIHTRLSETKEIGFETKVLEDATSVGLRYADLELLQEKSFSGMYTTHPWKRLEDLYGAVFEEGEIVKKVGTPVPSAIRYVMERKRSKFQY